MSGPKHTFLGRHTWAAVLFYAALAVLFLVFLSLGGMDGFANGTHP